MKIVETDIHKVKSNQSEILHQISVIQKQIVSIYCDNQELRLDFTNS